MKTIGLYTAYIYLFIAVITGIASNGFLKNTDGFTKSCKECWLCHERKWAFKTFDNEWLL